MSCTDSFIETFKLFELTFEEIPIEDIMSIKEHLKHLRTLTDLEKRSYVNKLIGDNRKIEYYDYCFF